MWKNFDTNFLIKKLEKIFLKKTFYKKLFFDSSLYKMFTKNWKMKETNFSEKKYFQKTISEKNETKNIKALKTELMLEILHNMSKSRWRILFGNRFFRILRMKIEKQIYYHSNVFAEARAMDSFENHTISWRKWHCLWLAEKSLFGWRFSMCGTIGAIQIRIFSLKD